MLHKDSMANTFIVSIALCVFCSLLVSGAAVALKERQENNKRIDRQRNVIAAAGISEKPPKQLSGAEIEKLFEERVTRRLVVLTTGEYVAIPDQEEDEAAFNAYQAYQPRDAAKDPAERVAVEGEFDIGLANREPKTWVYLINDKDGNVEQVVLPIYGMGLWSTLYGYVALDDDCRTINGLTYYEHGETAGLGGEVENKLWKSKWVGKQIWKSGSPRKDDNLLVGVAKGAPLPAQQDYMVDGLSGATITSRGVDSMLKYWFGSNGFGPFIDSIAPSEQGDSDGSANG